MVVEPTHTHRAMHTKRISFNMHIALAIKAEGGSSYEGFFVVVFLVCLHFLFVPYFFSPIIHFFLSVCLPVRL